MFRDMLSGSRAIQAGLVFFVLVVAGSSLYSWHVHRTTDAELAQSNALLQQHANKNEPHTATDTTDTSTVDVDLVETALETDDVQMPDNTGVSPIDETSEMLDMADAFLPDDFVSEEEIVEDVPVSPFGFGAYPEVPADFPEDVNWSDYEEDLPIYELMTRVQIKLWKQGHRAMGISEENGVMYPVIRGRVYIKWSRSGKEVLEVTGHPADMSDAIVNQIESGIIPAGLTVLNYDTAGIDPYEFLNLQ